MDQGLGGWGLRFGGFSLAGRGLRGSRFYGTGV